MSPSENGTTYSGRTDGYYNSIGGNACNTHCMVEFTDKYTLNSPHQLLLLATPCNGTDRCQRLGNRTVVLMSDITMQQSAACRLDECHTLSPAATGTAALHQKEGSMGIIIIIGRTSLRSSWAIDTLIRKKFTRNLNRGWHWMDVIHRLFEPDIFVFSLGPHLAATPADAFQQTLDVIAANTPTLPSDHRQLSFAPSWSVKAIWLSVMYVSCSYSMSST
jgi:hypothetical protein